MATELLKFENAFKALATATSIIEVKDIHNKATAISDYAKKSKDTRLIKIGVEWRKRSERRLGELIAESPKATAGRPSKNRVFKKPDLAATLADRGIDKNLANRARIAAAMPKDKFEATVARAIRMAIAASEGIKSVIAEARAERHEAKKKKRNQREHELAQKIEALPNKHYGIIVADPEWRFEFWSEKGKTNSSAENHYSTSQLEDIKRRDVPSISADDCILYLWATVPMLREGLEVLAAWGFRYVTNFAAVKNKAGTGYWNRNQHEHVLVGTRGKPPAPADGTQWSSVLDFKVGRHSAKPENLLEMIEQQYPNLPKIELNRRGPAREGWDAWGNEVESS